MDLGKEVRLMLDEVLSLGGRSASFTNDTHLLGAIPELDSMAVVALITACEERFGIVIDDDDVEGSTFATVGSFSDFIGSKLSA
jgi:acyl carrier protein